MPKLLILFAHPLLEKSRVHQALIAQAALVPGITINDLYQRYPDFDIDIQREQDLLLTHDIILWQHPFYWYSAPALLKQWQDLVLEHGWAYGRKGQALTGKKIGNVFSSGGTAQAYQVGGYNNHPVKDYLLPFERTATLCRMHYLPPFWVPGVHRMEPPQIREYAMHYRALLTALQEGRFSEDEIFAQSLLNDLLPMTSTH